MSKKTIITIIARLVIILLAIIAMLLTHDRGKSSAVKSPVAESSEIKSPVAESSEIKSPVTESPATKSPTAELLFLISASILAAAIYSLFSEPLEKLIAFLNGEHSESNSHCPKDFTCPEGILKVFKNDNNDELKDDFVQSITNAKQKIIVIGRKNVQFLEQRKADIISACQRKEDFKVVFCLLNALDTTVRLDWVYAHKAPRDATVTKDTYQRFYQALKQIKRDSNFKMLNCTNTFTFFTSVIIDDKIVYFFPYVCAKEMNGDPEPRIKVTGDSIIGKAIIKHSNYLLEEAKSDFVHEIDVEQWREKT